MAESIAVQPSPTMVEQLIRYAKGHIRLVTVAVSLLAILVALLIGAVLIALAGLNPWLAYGYMLRGSFGNLYGIGETLTRFVPMLLAGLGFEIAYKSGFFNVGTEGQLYMGALGSLLVGVYVQGLPPLLHVSLALLAGFVFGAVWALLAGALKISVGANELITTMMLNYIAFLLVEYLINTPLKDPEMLIYQTREVLPSAQLPYLLPGTRLHAGVLLAFLAVWATYYFLYRTPLGYQLRTIGANPKAAAYAGMNLVTGTLVAVLVSGGLSGLGGSAELLGSQRVMMAQFSPGFGFDGVSAAIMGRHNPLGIAMATLLLAVIRVGAGAMQRGMGVPFPILMVIQGLIILMVVSSVYLINKLTTTVIGGRA